MTDTTEWHPLVRDAYLDPHWLVHPAGELGVLDASIDAYRYNSGVVSICFSWWEDGLSPFYSDAVQALNEAGIPNYQGDPWRTNHLHRLVRTRYLHEELVKLRHAGNLAYVARLQQGGRGRIHSHHVSA